MSVHSQTRRVTVPDIRAHKGAAPVVVLTCYHAHTARLLDSHVDVMLVGDSLGMVMHGLETTLGVTLEMMIAHGKAVMRGAQKALVVVDNTFGSYEESPEVAFRNAARVIQETGCTAVKLEGGSRMAATIHYLTERGIPVMAHIGLTPQMVHVKGGFRTVGRTEEDWPLLLADAQAVAEAGAFAVVLEGMAAGGENHRRNPHPYHRHRRQPGLRRPGAGDGGHAGPQSRPAQIRAPVRPAGPGHRGGGPGLCTRCPRPRLSRRGKRLSHEKSPVKGPKSRQFLRARALRTAPARAN